MALTPVHFQGGRLEGQMWSLVYVGAYIEHPVVFRVRWQPQSWRLLTEPPPILTERYQVVAPHPAGGFIARYIGLKRVGGMPLAFDSRRLP